MANRNKPAEREGNDLERSGRVKTEVTTMTVVEDRTSEALGRPVMEYHAEDIELDGGTILTSYGEPKGGFPVAEQADA